MLIAAAYGGWQIYLSARFSAQRSVSKTNLKQIGLALHQYHDQYGSFPPAYVLGPDEKPWHSWRVLLLPFLGANDLYSQYRFDEPWDGPNNRKLLASGPAVYTSPFQKNLKPGTASYLAVVSRRTMWPAYFPVRIEDVTDGISNTIQLIEQDGSDVVWCEPRDMRERDAIAMLKPPPRERKFSVNKSETFLIAMADGSVRSVWQKINRDLFVSLLTPKYRELMVANDQWPAGLFAEDRGESPPLPVPIDSNKLPGTRVVPTSDSALETDKSVLYCATIQIAWDQLRPEPKEPVDVHGPTPVTESLNARPFPLSDLAEESYFVMASGLDPQQTSGMFDSFRKRFPNAPTEMLQPREPVDDFGNALQILVHLQKSLPFPEVLQRIPDPMKFPAGPDGKPVQTFGWLSAPGEGAMLPALQETVEIRDYESDDDFVLLLRTDSSQGDEIILAKVAPADSLQGTWKAVESRVRSSNLPEVLQHLRGVDQLQIPNLSIGILRSFRELNSLRIPTAKSPDRFIAEAQQTIQFRLDEYGAELISDIQMIVGENGHSEPRKNRIDPRKLVFDKSFLLVLRQRNAESPYFLAWIGNADLMETVK